LNYVLPILNVQAIFTLADDKGVKGSLGFVYMKIRHT